jgi:biopolymer transport protein TolR
MLIKGNKGRNRRRPMADINVTPMVDVMLVLLIVFMITAPMLATGVPVNLPWTRAEQLPSDKDQPLLVTINKEGKLFVGTQTEPIEIAQLSPVLKGIAQNNMEKRVYLRADGTVTHEQVMVVLALLQRSGFRNAALPVDSKDLKRVEDMIAKGATP